MNSIITLNRLSELVARAGGVKIAEAEAYLKAFMETAKQALSQDGHLYVKGIGAFKAIDENGERKIAFQPDAELAGNVNSPFSMFAPEELAPGASIDNLDIDIAIDDPEFMVDDNAKTAESVLQDAPAPEEPAVEIHAQEETIVEAPEPEEPSIDVHASHAPAVDEPTPEEPATKPIEYNEQVTYSAVDETDAEPKTNLAAAYGPRPSFPPEPEEDDEYQIEYYDEEYDDASGGKFPVFWTTWALIIGLLVGLAIGFFAHDPICELLEPTVIEQEEDDYTEETIDVVEPQSDADAVEAEEQTAPQTAPVEADVYDTITERTFLTHLAQKHYHQKDYWVYIYLENQEAIGNPNTVKAGTRVKIPPLSKYAKHQSEAENLKEAKALAAKILQK